MSSTVRRLAPRLFAWAAVAAATGCAFPILPPPLPDSEPIRRYEILDQGWSDGERNWFHHVSQGTTTPSLPYAWLVALEQPSLSFFEQPLVADPDYMARYGFLRSPRSQANPGGLPIGFARQLAVPDWGSGKQEMAVGFTCAACHTGQIEYKGTAIRIEGGPAVTDLGKYRAALALALAYTYVIPPRFSRFADRVLGPDAPSEARDQLKAELRAAIDRGIASPELRDDVLRQSTEEGYTRLDALGRIGNYVFAVGMKDDNIRPLRAPVSYPPIWDTPWFDWVQYNGSIRMPMTRNAGEALGVFASSDWRGQGGTRYRSSVQVMNLHLIEEQLGGAEPFSGLRSPRWPEHVLGPIDRAKAAKGAELYKEICQGCHLPPIDSREIQDARYWEELGGPRRLLRLPMKEISIVGTDPNQARDMLEREVDASIVELDERRFAWALGRVVDAVVQRWHDDQVPPTPEDERDRMQGARPPHDGVRALLAYRTRPLNGVWATSPYLHNGSVPNLYELLSPGEERSRVVFLGNREFDPEKVGLIHDRHAKGYTVLRPEQGCEKQERTDGNCNRGHEFRDGPRGGGTIGRLLDHDERMALIEYLKTL